MKIRTLHLQTSKFHENKDFYTKCFGLELSEETDDVFSVKIGWSILKFEKSIRSCLYHYCFLISPNLLEQALGWMEQRVDIIKLESEEKIIDLKDWNAKSFYFYDGSGNLAEFIAHGDVDDSCDQDFNISKVLGINEIGIGTDNVQRINRSLEENCQTKFWKGDLDRFGTNGSAEGRFIIANYNKKETWFPTEIKITPVPFEVEIENKDQLYKLKYIDGSFKKAGM